MNEALKPYVSIAQAVETLLHPYAEVVIHDATTGTIAALFHPSSGRQVGDESLIEEGSYPDIFPSYTKTSIDGRRFKSVTATLRDAAGAPIGLLCVNLDISMFDSLCTQLSAFMRVEAVQPSELFRNDWREKIGEYVQNALRERGKSLDVLSRGEKRELVHELHRQGAFVAKNAASYVASVLNLSRATIYKYLSERSL